MKVLLCCFNFLLKLFCWRSLAGEKGRLLGCCLPRPPNRAWFIYFRKQNLSHCPIERRLRALFYLSGWLWNSFLQLRIWHGSCRLICVLFQIVVVCQSQTSRLSHAAWRYGGTRVVLVWRSWSCGLEAYVVMFCLCVSFQCCFVIELFVWMFSRYQIRCPLSPCYMLQEM